MKALVFCLAQTLEGNGLWYSDIETIQREYWRVITHQQTLERLTSDSLSCGDHAGPPGCHHHRHGQPGDLGAGPGTQADLSPAYCDQGREETRHQEGGQL